MQTNGEFMADKLMDLANMVASALVFGQLINNEIVWWVVAIGVSFFCLCIVISSLLRKEKGRDKNG